MSGMIPGAAGSQEPELEYATKGTSARLVETEAAIKRVRGACANGYPDAQYPDYDGGYQTACEDILRALDGDA